MTPVGELEPEAADATPPAPTDTPHVERSKLTSASEVLFLYAACLFVALALAAILVELASDKGSWSSVYTVILDGAVRSPGRWGLTLGVSAPILLVALGTTVSGRAGLVNIGQEGQLVIGAAFTAYLGVRIGGPGPLALLISLACGVIGGAIWAGIAGVLRFWRNVPEVLTTLLMGVVAANLMGWGLRHQLPASGAARRTSQPQPGQRTVRAQPSHPSRHVVRQRVPDQRPGRRRPRDRRVAGAGSHGGGVPAAHAGSQCPYRAARRCVARSATASAQCSCRAASPAWPVASC